MTRAQNSEALVVRLLLEHHAAMQRLASSFTDSVSGPEDIVSQARLVALSRHEDVADVTNPLGWLLTITRSVGLSIVRKRNRRSELRGAWLLDDSLLFLEPPEVDVFRKWEFSQVEDERRGQVLTIARSLPDALRQLLEHVLIDGWGDDDIASHYDITVAAVRQRRKRAVAAVRGRMLPQKLPE